MDASLRICFFIAACWQLSPSRADEPSGVPPSWVYTEGVPARDRAFAASDEPRADVDPQAYWFRDWLTGRATWRLHSVFPLEPKPVSVQQLLDDQWARSFLFADDYFDQHSMPLSVDSLRYGSSRGSRYFPYFFAGGVSGSYRWAYPSGGTFPTSASSHPIPGLSYVVGTSERTLRLLIGSATADAAAPLPESDPRADRVFDPAGAARSLSKFGFGNMYPALRISPRVDPMRNLARPGEKRLQPARASIKWTSAVSGSDVRSSAGLRSDFTPVAPDVTVVNQSQAWIDEHAPHTPCALRSGFDVFPVPSRFHVEELREFLANPKPWTIIEITPLVFEGDRTP